MIIAWIFFILSCFFWITEIIEFYLMYKMNKQISKSNEKFWFWFVICALCAQYIWG